jgi:hypothetical protein
VREGLGLKALGPEMRPMAHGWAMVPVTHGEWLPVALGPVAILAYSANMCSAQGYWPFGPITLAWVLMAHARCMGVMYNNPHRGLFVSSTHGPAVGYCTIIRAGHGLFHYAIVARGDYLV